MADRSRFWSYSAEVLSLDSVEPPEMAGLLAYWRSNAHGDVPDQRDLEVRQMEGCTGNIALVTIREKPLRGRYKLIGRNLISLLGADPTDKYVHEVYGSSVSSEIYQAFEKSIESRAPVYFRREFQILGKSFGYHRLIFPLTLRSEKIDRLLVCIFPTNPKLRNAKQWKSVVRELHQLETAERKLEQSWLSSQQESRSVTVES